MHHPGRAEVHDDAEERKQAIMEKATNNSPQAANAEQSKGADRRTHQKGSRVTQARARAQRVKLDTLAEARHVQDEQETVNPTTQNKKTVRQEMPARPRIIATLIEASIQAHICGNSSHK